MITKTKASGTIIDVNDNLYLLTNWHVVTGRKWMTPAEQSHWDSTNPEKICWAAENSDQEHPVALDVQIPLSGRLLRLARLALDDVIDDGDVYEHRYAWDDPSNEAMAYTPPKRDLTCIRLGSDGRHWSNIISAIAGEHITLGYQLNEIGLDHRPQVGDRVFVVGYPMQIGLSATDPPVWTSGSIATPPDREWNGPRFLIDSRTRKGQSGSAVIVYAPATGGLPPRHQLLGIYSGRIDAEADIGSAWRVDELVNDLFKGTHMPRDRVLAPIENDPTVPNDDAQPDSYILKDLDLDN